MKDLLERLSKALANNRNLQRESISGLSRYGVFEHDPNVVVRIDDSDNKTFGRLDEASSEFIPFTPEEEADFKRRFRWFFTTIFDRDNVVPFRPRKTT